MIRPIFKIRPRTRASFASQLEYDLYYEEERRRVHENKVLAGAFAALALVCVLILIFATPGP